MILGTWTLGLITVGAQLDVRAALLAALVVDATGAATVPTVHPGSRVREAGWQTVRQCCHLDLHLLVLLLLLIVDVVRAIVRQHGIPALAEEGQRFG
uniref:Putative secreted peptide n=1 Tax=Anopheles braziliensis TaxID=58242 RepID=A0A2M3ZTQ5_9DIPT